MNEKTCKDCKCFIQHYGIDVDGAFTVDCGHCECPRTEKRVRDNPACDMFTDRR